MAKAKITDGDLKGVEFEISEETIHNILAKAEPEEKEVRVWTFLAKKQPNSPGTFIFALKNPAQVCGEVDYGLPEEYKGRGAFTSSEISRIAHGLLDLIGEGKNDTTTN